MNLIADRLQKKFGAITAVEDVSFAATPGKILGLLGPNGAGKSTTIGMIAGLITPDTGTVKIDGAALRTGADPSKRNIGLVTQEIALVEELPGRKDQWADLVDRHRLQAPSDILEFCGYNSIVYADTQLSGRRRPGPDPGPILNSTIAVRQAGFHDCIDTEDMFVKWFRRLQDDRVLPPG